MKVYISKHGDQIFFSDLPIQSDGKQLITIGWPRFKFSLTNEELEDSRTELLRSFGIKNDGNYKMELRRWPQE